MSPNLLGLGWSPAAHTWQVARGDGQRSLRGYSCLDNSCPGAAMIPHLAWLTESQFLCAHASLIPDRQALGHSTPIRSEEKACAISFCSGASPWLSSSWLLLVVSPIDAQDNDPSRQGLQSNGAAPASAAPQATLGTSFTYQGFLTTSGSPATGQFDFRFRMFNAATGDSPVGGDKLANDVQVRKGVFTVQLNYGLDDIDGEVFFGDARWIEVAVRPGTSSGSYTVLSPRQELTATPYAFSLYPGANVQGDVPTGTPSSPQTLRPAANPMACAATAHRQRAAASMGGPQPTAAPPTASMARAPHRPVTGCTDYTPPPAARRRVWQGYPTRRPAMPLRCWAR